LEQASIHSNAQLSTEQNRRRAAEAEETLARAELLKWRELVGQMNKVCLFVCLLKARYLI
jgi:hypothetical protein